MTERLKLTNTIETEDSTQSDSVARILFSQTNTEPIKEGCIFTEEEIIPRDRFNLVYWIVLFHGIGTLLPWNMFITIAPSYYTNYKMKYADANGSYTQDSDFSANYLHFQLICAQLPSLLFNFANIFTTSKGDIVKRISVTLPIIAGVVILTMSFIYVDTWTWMTGFFFLTLISIVILNAANGVYQNSIFGLVSDFPFKYTNAVLIGNNACGTFATVLHLIVQCVMSDVQSSAMVYFTIALLSLIVCFSSIFFLKDQPFYRYHSQKGDERREREFAIHGPPSTQDYIEAFKQCLPQLINVFIVFFVTLCIFPGMMVDITYEGAGEAYDFWIPKKYFGTVTCFLVFNVFAFIGAMLADKYQWPGPKKLWIPVSLRLLFIPFFLLCNYRVEHRGSFPVLFSNVYLYMFASALMSITSGYFSGLAMVYSNITVEKSKQRIAGMMAGFFLIFGIVVGIACSLAIGLIF